MRKGEIFVSGNLRNHDEKYCGEQYCSEEYFRQYQAVMRNMQLVRLYVEKHMTELEHERVREIECGLGLIAPMTIWVDPKEAGKALHAISVAERQIKADSGPLIVASMEKLASVEKRRPGERLELQKTWDMITCYGALAVIHAFFREYLENWADE